MYKRNTDWTLNKLRPGCIVCPAVMGNHVLLKPESFESVEEFARWKTWSDESYYDIERHDRTYDDYTDSYSGWEECTIAAGAIASPEDRIIKAEERAAWEDRKSLMRAALASLTDVQRRRLMAHYLDGMTYTQIAEIEGCAAVNVSRSVRTGVDKIVKFFRDQG